MENKSFNLDELLGATQTEETSTDTQEAESGSEESSQEGNESQNTDESSNEEGSTEQEGSTEEESAEGDDSGDSGENNDSQNINEENSQEETSNQESEAAPKSYEFKDDYIKKAVEYYEQYGTLTPYLEAASANYDALNDLDILKLKFDKDNSDLSAKAREKLFQKELEKYNLDEYADEDDREVGQALLKRDANKLRTTLKDEQQQFINSIQPQQEQIQQISNEEIAKQRAESLKMIQSGVKSAVNGNLLRIESNGEGINYQISDVNKVIEYAAEPEKFLSSFAKDGGVDWKTWTMLVALKDNPEQFVGELIKHGKSLGRKAMEAELKNAAPLTNSKEISDVETSIERPSDNPTEFLKGMKVLRK